MSETIKKPKNCFVEGEILPGFIAQSIEKHSSMLQIGAHSIFLGQVRNDDKDGQKVIAIEYSCFREMADMELHAIREETFSKFQLSCMHIHHSLGLVPAGKISLFVFTSSKHRATAIEACTYVVEAIKSRAPVWGKEILSDHTHNWKINN
jgi:molybdopterin synthase catalytic subunit